MPCQSSCLAFILLTSIYLCLPYVKYIIKNQLGTCEHLDPVRICVCQTSKQVQKAEVAKLRFQQNGLQVRSYSQHRIKVSKMHLTIPWCLLDCKASRCWNKRNHKRFKLLAPTRWVVLVCWTQYHLHKYFWAWQNSQQLIREQTPKS